MPYLAAFLGRLSETQKAMTALASAFAVGVTITVAAFAYVGLPDELSALQETVQENKRAATANAEAIADVRHQYDTLICLMTLPDTISPLLARRECGA